MITIRNLCVRYGQREVLNNVSLDLKKGHIYALVGPSGCGKTTLLNILCRVNKDYDGSITMVPPFADLRIGFVPQHYGLLPWKTVRQNILLPARVGKKKEGALQSFDEVITTLGIDHLLGKFPHAISGGEQQRVALARAFLSQPDLLLMDEPFSALDAFTSASSQKLFLRLWSQFQVTTVFITHSMKEAVTLGQYILLMGVETGAGIQMVSNDAFGDGTSEAAFRLTERLLDSFYRGVE